MARRCRRPASPPPAGTGRAPPRSHRPGRDARMRPAATLTPMRSGPRDGAQLESTTTAPNVVGAEMASERHWSCSSRSRARRNLAVHQPGGRVDAVVAPGRAVPLGGPGPEGRASSPTGSTQSSPSCPPPARPTGPGPPGRPPPPRPGGRPRPGLGERHDGLLDLGQLATGRERRGQAAGRRVGPLGQGQPGRGTGVPAGEEAAADRPVRRPRPVDDCQEPHGAVRALVVDGPGRPCVSVTPP